MPKADLHQRTDRPGPRQVGASGGKPYTKLSETFKVMAKLLYKEELLK
jgi:hypothetical protein